jgi:hypothetical protein
VSSVYLQECRVSLGVLKAGVRSTACKEMAGTVCRACVRAFPRISSSKSVKSCYIRCNYVNIRCLRRLGRNGCSKSANRQSTFSAAAVDVPSPPAVTEITEIKDVMDIGMQGFDRAVAENVRRVIPAINQVQVLCT